MLASPRLRRRLAWAAALGLVFAAAVFGALRLGTPPSDEEVIERGRGWEAPARPDAVEVTPPALVEPLTVAARFIETAVARKRVGDSWSLVSPSLKSGFTRSEWASGDIPVVPYPVDSAKWKLDYSFQDQLGFEVALFPARGRKIRATVFKLDMTAVGEGDRRRWLVEAFTPGVVRSVPAASGAPLTSAGLPDLRAQTDAGTSRLSGTWLLFPVGLLGLALLVPLSFGALQVYRNRRAERRFARARGL